MPRTIAPSTRGRGRAIDDAVAVRIGAGDARITTADVELDELVDLGCEHHPGPQTHALMADHAIAFLRTEVMW